MKITESLSPITTVGELSAFLAHALTNGAPLDAPIVMTKGRTNDVTGITIDVPSPKVAFHPDDAVASLATGDGAARRRGPRAEAPVEPVAE